MIGLMLGIGLMGLSRADELTSVIAQADEAIAQGNYRRAQRILRNAESDLGDSTTLVGTEELALLFFYQGTVQRLREDTRGRTMEAWRKTLAIDNEFEWDSRYLGEGDDWSLFEALRTEIRSNPSTELSIPEARGRSVLYVDGIERTVGDTVWQGQHLAQIRCDDDVIRSGWTDFSDDYDWFALCPGGVDTTVVVENRAEPQDEWAEFGPVFGSVGETETNSETTNGDEEITDEETSVQSTETGEESSTEETEVLTDSEESVDSEDGPEPDPEEQTEEQTEATPEESSSLAVEDGIADTREGIDLFARLPRPEEPVSLLVGGGGLLLASTVVNLSVVNPRYDAVEAAREDPSSVTRAEADELTLLFNRARFSVIGLGAVGMGLMGWGSVLMFDSDSDLAAGPVDLRAYVGAGQVRFEGRF